MSLQDNIVKIGILQNLLRAGTSPEEIPKILGIHRATVYRWIKRIRISGIRQFKKDYKEAKRGRRVHNKTHGSVRTKILEIRKERKDCCGEKIQYFLKKEGMQNILSQSTIYRILGANIKLRSRWKKNSYRGDVPKGTKRGEVIQIDTVHCENLFVFTGIDTFTKEPFVQLSTECTAKEGERFIRNITKHYSSLHDPIVIGLIQRDGGPEVRGECETYIRRYRNLDGSEVKLRTARPLLIPFTNTTCVPLPAIPASATHFAFAEPRNGIEARSPISDIFLLYTPSICIQVHQRLRTAQQLL